MKKKVFFLRFGRKWVSEWGSNGFKALSYIHKYTLLFIFCLVYLFYFGLLGVGGDWILTLKKLNQNIE